jgi:hypothetical protein
MRPPHVPRTETKIETCSRWSDTLIWAAEGRSGHWRQQRYAAAFQVSPYGSNTTGLFKRGPEGRTDEARQLHGKANCRSVEGA